MSNLTANVHDRSIEVTHQLLEDITAGYPRRDFAVRLWNGSIWGDAEHSRFTFVLKHPGALRCMLLGASEKTLGEAYIYSDFDVDGDLEAAFEFGEYLIAQEVDLTRKLHLAALLLKLPPNGHHGQEDAAPHLEGALHSRQRDRRAVTYHYNQSNDFYSLWLDRRMVYSCAYFESGDEDIDTAQEQKLDYVCRKLRLRKGERLLDVGCGWGGLILYAAQKFGVHARGITLSEAQAQLARTRIEESGLGDRCDVQICDYRDLEPAPFYDKIVSVGMFEHVGESRLPEYFRQVWNLLKPGGVFLNHGIAASATFRRKGASFIDKYVFPDDGLVPLATTLRAAEACGFEVRDVECLREHYARTLRHWARGLESHYDAARHITNEVICRIWRIYMEGCARAFATGRVSIYQVVLSKPDHGNANLPLTRADWYIGGS